MIRSAKELSDDQKQVIESLLGRHIADEEEISVRALEATKGVTPERRAEVLAGLREYFATVDARRQPVPAHEADEIIDEALRSTRPGYRSVR
jgi:hypothetical protein